MWFLWIVITAIVVLFNFTQVASFVYARIILGKELGNEVIKKRLLGLIFNSAVVLTWLILCIAVEAINKYVAVNVVSWIVFIVISIGIVNHNATDVARDAADIIGNDYPPSIDEMLKTMRELNEGYDNAKKSQDRIQAIINGEEREISYCDVVYAVTNLLDARKNLSPDNYAKIEEIFDRYAEMKETRLANMWTYFAMAQTIIDDYEEVAPYFLMDGKMSENLSREDIDIIWDEWKTQNNRI